MYSEPYYWGVLQGVREFIHAHPSWRATLYATPNAYRVARSTGAAPPDGVLMSYGPLWKTLLPELRCPVVDVNGLLTGRRAARVSVDDVAVGEMAARHFAERRFQDVGYVGYGQTPYSTARARGLRQATVAAGVRLHVAPPIAPGQLPGAAAAARTAARIAAWVDTLPRPVGIVACHDPLALATLAACRRRGWRVPQDVAVLGVDNFGWECEYADPPLSSVIVPTERIGFRAAETLSHWLDTGVAPSGPIFVQPGGVITRTSTHLLVSDDPVVVDATRFIRNHADRPIGVDDVVRAVSVSRRSLEQRFHRALGRTPLNEIHAARVDRAKELLARTSLPMPAIAERCGFRYATHFAATFQRQSGESPTAYRRRLGRAKITR